MSVAAETITHGIRANRAQFSHQLLQVLFVGLALGMMRTVVPALAESEFGVPRQSFLLLGAFVLAFGIVKSVLNLLAGFWSERWGRQRVLALGWLAAIPVPVLILFAENWYWVVAATLLLGVNQGLAWSMTQTAKLDLAGRNQRGFAIGLNEFAGYVGVAIAGVATAYLAERYGMRAGLFGFGLAVIVTAGALSLCCVRDTRAWAQAEQRAITDHAVDNEQRAPKTALKEVFARVTWRDRRLASVNQAGLVEKFVDVLVWVFFPALLFQRGLSLAQIGWVVSVYAFTWGGLQLFTGKLSDRIGRRRPIVWGMWLCAAGVALAPLDGGVLWWSFAAGIIGTGMALLYPNLSAAVGDLAAPAWRGTAIGVYRFWRDFGYAVGAAAIGTVAWLIGAIEAAFVFTAVAMAISGAIVWVWLEPAQRERQKR